MKKLGFTFIIVLYVFQAFPQENEEIKDYAEAFKLVEAWLDAQKDYEQLPGISAAVVKDQNLLWSGAFGKANIEGNVKTETSTLCSICSISKLFTSVAIMKLYDEGKIRLDDDINDLLPSYDLKQKYPESGPITIRSLMTHSSGLPREAAYPYWTGPDFPFPNEEEINAKLGEQETLYPASTYFQYSNLGITLLGEVVEEVSDMPYKDYVSQNILKPLGLSNTRPELPEKLYGNELAIGYSSLTRDATREKLDFFQANGITPAAGFSSNVLDLCKFASWQFRLRDTTVVEILKPSTLKYMQTVQWMDPDWGTSWGLGFRVYKGPDKNTWVGHGGSCPGYRSELALNLKDKMGYSVMINASGTDPSKYVKGIYGIMNKSAPGKEEKEVKSEELDEYTGYYNEMPWWGEVYISTWKGKLVALYLPAEKPEESMTFFKRVKGDIFRRLRDDGELGEELVFERDSEGKIIRLKQFENYSVKIAR